MTNDEPVRLLGRSGNRFTIRIQMQSAKAILLYGTIIALAIGVTLVSRRFVRPVDCHAFCNASAGTPCPPGACRDGEQRAGLPLPFLVDNGGGSSPIEGWGVLGPEDIPNPLTFLLDVLFYGVLLWFVVYMVSLRRSQQPEERRLPIILSLAVLLLGSLVSLALYWPYLTK